MKEKEEEDGSSSASVAYSSSREKDHYLSATLSYHLQQTSREFFLPFNPHKKFRRG